jgi:sensor histidine kinase YesM
MMNSNYLRSLRIVYFALAMGIVFFMLVTLLLNRMSGPFAQENITASDRTPFLIVLIVITGSIFIAYRVIIPKKQEAIRALPTLDKKLLAWRELCVLQGALIEAPAFFALVLFLLLGIYTLLVWPLAGIFLFWITQPTRDKLISEANLSPSEIAEFDSMD